MRPCPKERKEGRKTEKDRKSKEKEKEKRKSKHPAQCILKQFNLRFPPHPPPFHSSPTSSFVFTLACSFPSGISSTPLSQSFSPVWSDKHALGSGVTGAMNMSRAL